MNFKRFHESKNLFDPNSTRYEYAITEAGKIVSYSGGAVYILPVENGETYTLKIHALASVRILRMAFYDYETPINNDFVYNLIKIENTVQPQITLINSENHPYLIVQVAGEFIDDYGINSFMLNTGSTALPYEPYSSEVWHDIPHYIHNTSTDTLTTLPADIYANDTTATVGLKGQMEQSDTPTSTAPIQPSECGERTAQLIPEIVQGGVSTTDGSFSQSSNRLRTKYIPVESGKTYAVGSGNLYLATGCYYNNGVFSSQIDEVVALTTSATFTVPENVNQIAIGFRTANGTTDITPSDLQNYMLNKGSTVLPYEPYGQYKIPILNNSQTTNVYLGEVQSTRRIRKLVLTGEEDIEIKSGNAKWYIPIADMRTPANIGVIAWYCSHYQAVANNASWTSYDYMISWSSADIGADRGLRIRDINFLSSSLADFKAYLAQQYSAGTPVCVWYVLLESTTGIVNEPLRKIGDYADTVSGITIPTTAGTNTISVDTTLQPSEVSVTYKGWHPVQSVHERENGAWT